ncbi:MAG: glycyl-radical enzyme activating protein [Solobacterium sp.]|nr:glycyl-radical enzyme activating protein [Solobacterium sp.]
MPESETALVFDIKRFAVHDGSGIRTTVFFKGCPLRCVWCQNPEGLEPERSVVYLSSRCVHCGICKSLAEEGQLSWEKDHPVINRNSSGSFERITAECPSGALAYDCRAYTEDELMERILDDRVFFRESGGVTFSGGEPFYQGMFLIRMLEKCQKEGIRTALETSLYTSSKLLKAAIPLLDEAFADLKIFDEEAHRTYTGADNHVILSNMRILLESELRERVTVRTPLIPGITASEENIRAISSYISGIDPDVKYELLNYNDLAPAKYEMTGKTWTLADHAARFSKEELKRFEEAAEQGGIRNLVRAE